MGASTLTTIICPSVLVAPAVARKSRRSMSALAASSACCWRSSLLPARKNMDAMQRWPASPSGLPISSVSLALMCSRSSYTPAFQSAGYQTAMHKRHSGSRQAYGGDVPAPQFGDACQRHRQAIFCQASAAEDGFERQPFQAGTGLKPAPHAIACLQFSGTAGSAVVHLL